MKVFCLEGNLAAGKSSLLTTLNSFNRPWLSTLPENVEEWKSQKGFGVEGKKFNYLQTLYTSKRNFHFPFQTFMLYNYANQLDAALKSVTDTSSTGEHVLVTERSLLTSLHVFANTSLVDQELSVLQGLADRLISSSPMLGQMDGIFHIDTNPVECFRRLQVRGRSEEAGVTMHYLEDIDAAHKIWANNFFQPYTPNVIKMYDSALRSNEDIAVDILSIVNSARTA